MYSELGSVFYRKNTVFHGQFPSVQYYIAEDNYLFDLLQVNPLPTFSEA